MLCLLLAHSGDSTQLVRPLRARSGHSHIEKKTAELYSGSYKNEKGFSIMNIYATKTETFKRFVAGVLSSYSATISNESKLNLQNGTTSSEEALMWLINKAFQKELKTLTKFLSIITPA